MTACNICGKYFSGSKDLYWHIVIYHVIPEGLYGYGQCCLCGETLADSHYGTCSKIKLIQLRGKSDHECQRNS